ncbi:hypothetical protein O3M35_010980 [Rhynocoris fuscipes]|uniref:Secreted protein n=1 Tax=Rhynocoris fuscipes TaxID=488301 RepID=A0AAW1D3B9_9HEMI
MNLFSSIILLVAIINLIAGTPEIKSADPLQQNTRGTPSFLTVQQQRYDEAVKGRQRPAGTPRSHGYQSRGGGAVSNPDMRVLPRRRYEETSRRSQPVIPQKTDRHEVYGRGNHLISSASHIPQKTDRHEMPKQSNGRNDKLFSYKTREDLRIRSRKESSDVEELWSTRDGSVKSEIIDSRLKLARPKYVEGVKG